MSVNLIDSRRASVTLPPCYVLTNRQRMGGAIHAVSS